MVGGQNVQAGTLDESRHVESVDQALKCRSDGELRASLRWSSRRAATGGEQVEQVIVLGLIELQRPGDRIEDLR
jgi:hypothetical protein